MINSVSKHVVAFAISIAFSTNCWAQDRTVEGKVSDFIGEAQMEMHQLFADERFPNVAVTVEGTVLATWGSSSLKLRRSEDGGKSFGKELVVKNPGFQPGGLTVNEKTGEVWIFVEANHPPADLFLYRSWDDGRSWLEQPYEIKPDSAGNMPSMHMNEHGITLRHGEHAGRLIRPSRYYAGKNEQSRWPDHYTNAIFSDDGGKTWQTSEPFPANGTGEAAVVELSDGTLYYNSRRHWAPEGESPLRRWTATSSDGGATWDNLQICEALPDGPQDTNYGCMGGLVRLPIADRDILIYSNCDSPSGRHHGTIWCSFDGGKSWPIKRLVYEGAFAYSSISAGRPDTPSQGWIYLHFEGGPEGGSTMARLNLSWALEGEPTGDGVVPEWVKQ